VTRKIAVAPKETREVRSIPEKQAGRVRTPDSPPLSERAIIATSKHSGQAPTDKSATKVWRNRWGRFVKPRTADAAPQWSVSAPGNAIAN
jgi:hypothetical protein